MGCNKVCNTCVIPVIISVIVGIIIGLIFTPIVAIGIIELLYAAIGLSTLFLIFLLVVALVGKRREEYCVFKYGKCLLIGSLGTIITAALAIALTLTEVITALFIGIVTFFAVLAIIQFVMLMFCVIKSSNMYKE